MILVLGIWAFLRVLLGRSTAVTLENVALRHQLMVLQRSLPRPRLRRQDRILWVCLSRLFQARPPPTTDEIAEVLEQVHAREQRLLRRRGRSGKLSQSQVMPKLKTSNGMASTLTST